MPVTKLSMDELHGGCVMRIRMPRTYSLRMKLGIWLIGLAGRVIHMPLEIDIVGRVEAPAHASRLNPARPLPKPKK